MQNKKKYLVLLSLPRSVRAPQIVKKKTLQMFVHSVIHSIDVYWAPTRRQALSLLLETQKLQSPFSLVRACYCMDTLCPGAYLTGFQVLQLYVWMQVSPIQLSSLSVQMSSAISNFWFGGHNLTGKYKLEICQRLESRALKLMYVWFFPQNSSFCF